MSNTDDTGNNNYGYGNSNDIEMSQTSPNGGPPHSHLRFDNQAATIARTRGVQPNEDYSDENYSDDDSEHGDTGGQGGGEKKPPLPNPRRPRSLVLLATIFIALIFTIASLPVTVMSYSKAKTDSTKKISIEVGYWMMSVCPADQLKGGCDLVSNDNYLCDEVVSALRAGGAFGVLAVIVEVFLLIVLGLEFCGFIIARSLSFRGSWVLWILLLIQWAIGSNVFLAKKCKDTSFHQMGFKYKAGWVLPLFCWLVLPIVLILMVVFKQKMQTSMR